MLVVGWQLWQLRRNLKAGVFGSRLAVRLVLAVRAGRGAAGRARLRGVGAVHRPQHRELVRRARRSRARRRPGPRPEDARLPPQGHGEQGQPDGGDARREPGQSRGRADPRGGADERVRGGACSRPPARCSRSRAPAARARRPSRRRWPRLRLARLQQAYSKIEQAPDGGLVLRVVVPVNTEDALESAQAPADHRAGAEGARAGCRARAGRACATTRSSRSRATALKRLYALTLTLTLLLALTSALGLAVVLSERFAAPLGLLAEGTRAVAQGDFTRRQPVVSRDELGVLTESFNTMTAQLAEAQGREQESRRAIETTRAYLESILGNLSAGVLVFDEGHRLRTVNPSAAVILQQPLADLIGMSLADWGKRLPALAPFAELVAEGFRGSRDRQWQKEAQLTVANLSRTLLMRGTRLPGTTTTGGYVVVFDDVSELVQAQRDAAWAEVARRLAHEIKNPLTPIQLSAERLAVKLARTARRRGRGDAAPRHADDRVAGRRDEAHGRRLRDLCAAAASRTDAARSTSRASCSTCLLCMTTSAPTLRYPCRTRPSTSRASPPACARCSTISSPTRSTPRPTSPIRVSRSRSRAGDGRGDARVRGRRPRLCRGRARARVRALRHHQAKGTGLGPCDREEDRRRARRPRRCSPTRPKAARA